MNTRSNTIETEKDAHIRVWEHPDLRDAIVSHMSTAQQYRLLTLSKACFKSIVKHLYRSWYYQPELLYEVKSRARLDLYTRAVRSLIHNGPKLNTAYDVDVVLNTFPNLRTWMIFDGFPDGYLIDRTGGSITLIEGENYEHEEGLFPEGWEVIRRPCIGCHHDTKVILSKWAMPTDKDTDYQHALGRGITILGAIESQIPSDVSDTVMPFQSINMLQTPAPNTGRLLARLFNSFPLPTQKLRFSGEDYSDNPAIERLVDLDFIRIVRQIPAFEMYWPTASDLHGESISTAELFANQPRWNDEQVDFPLRRVKISMSAYALYDRDPVLEFAPSVSDVANALLNMGGAACHYEIVLSSPNATKWPVWRTYFGLIKMEIQRAIRRVRRNRSLGWSKMEKEGAQ